MKLKHVYIVMGILLCASVYTLAEQDKGTQEEYCIIQGDNVPIRAKPDSKSTAIGKLEKYEFVYCIDRTEAREKEGEEDYWYRIRNCDNKVGWVFGKYVQYIDGTKEPGKYYKKMIEVEIINDKLCNPKNICRIYKLSYEHNHYIMDFEDEEKREYSSQYALERFRYLVFYKNIDGEFIETIHANARAYLFYTNYIILYSKKGFNIYNTKKFREKKGEPHFNILCKYYDSTGFYLRQDVISKIPECNTDWNARLHCISYSDMEFNRETMEVVVNIRKEKNTLLKQEKYKFKDGNFVTIE